MNRRNQENIKMRALRKIVGFTCRLIRSYIQVAASGLHNSVHSRVWLQKVEKMVGTQIVSKLTVPVWRNFQLLKIFVLIIRPIWVYMCRSRAGVTNFQRVAHPTTGSLAGRTPLLPARPREKNNKRKTMKTMAAAPFFSSSFFLLLWPRAADTMAGILGGPHVMLTGVEPRGLHKGASWAAGWWPLK